MTITRIDERAHAATKIQAAIRRILAKGLVLHRLDELTSCLRARCAIAIQGAYRCYTARNILEAKRIAFLRYKVCIIIVQSVIRRVLSRKIVARRKEELFMGTICALFIQSRYRLTNLLNIYFFSFY